MRPRTSMNDLLMCDSIFVLCPPPRKGEAITVKSFLSQGTARKIGSPISELHPYFHLDPGESRGRWVTEKLNGTFRKMSQKVYWVFSKKFLNYFRASKSRFRGDKPLSIGSVCQSVRHTFQRICRM